MFKYGDGLDNSMTGVASVVIVTKRDVVFLIVIESLRLT